ncbi:hypothetical protein [Pseudomonas sp. NPDC096950]|uniref:hypothetical protein n=1 Tax=Pseudomonas sp. NPDC096950 TaxID=3364485 RepID=UPI00383B1B1E
MGPNVESIRNVGVRQIRGRVPVQVRKELMGAVKAGELGRLKRDGLKPEFFFHPEKIQEAIDLQQREAEHSIALLSKVLA